MDDPGSNLVFEHRAVNGIWREGEEKKNINLKWNGMDSAEGAERYSREHISCENSFGAAIRYVNSDNFCSVDLKNNFGSLTVCFDNAIIQNAAAYVEIENNFWKTDFGHIAIHYI